MVCPVLFSQAVEPVVGENGHFDAAIEIGPHPVLKGPATQIIQDLWGEKVLYTGILSRSKDDLEAFADGL
jgi:hybrid polyketide synthase / nonribosomal peptide synthetase ACE1